MDSTNVPMLIRDDQDSHAAEAIVELTSLQLLMAGGGCGEIIVG